MFQGSQFSLSFFIERFILNNPHHFLQISLAIISHVLEELLVDHFVIWSASQRWTFSNCGLPVLPARQSLLSQFNVHLLTATMKNTETPSRKVPITVLVCSNIFCMLRIFCTNCHLSCHQLLNNLTTSLPAEVDWVEFDQEIPRQGLCRSANSQLNLERKWPNGLILVLVKMSNICISNLIPFQPYTLIRFTL